jgi:hypothetical protein
MQLYMVVGVILLVGTQLMVLGMVIGWLEHMIVSLGYLGFTNPGIGQDTVIRLVDVDVILGFHL